MSATAAHDKQNGASTRSASTSRRPAVAVTSLRPLVGAHPEALRAIYGKGVATDPAELGAAPRGRVLAFEGGADVFLLFRPLLRALDKGLSPWRGKVFDHGGNAGQNVVFGGKMARFRTEVGPSEVDGQPTLKLLYDSEAFKNPWPLKTVHDELRTVGPGVALGPAYVTMGGRPVCVLWFGLEAEASG